MRDVMAERDRYRDALEQIAADGAMVVQREDGPVLAPGRLQDIARAALTAGESE